MLPDVFYFIDERGGNPVKEFIDRLPSKEQTKVFAYMAELLQRGHQLRRPIADYLGNGIYELRPKNNRIFYFFFMKSSAVMIHAIRKTTHKIPESDLQLCARRKNQVEQQRRLEKIDFTWGDPK